MTLFLVIPELRSTFWFHLVGFCLQSTLTLLQWAFSAPPAERESEGERGREKEEKESMWGGGERESEKERDRERERKRQKKRESFINILYLKKPWILSKKPHPRNPPKHHEKERTISGSPPSDKTCRLCTRICTKYPIQTHTFALLTGRCTPIACRNSYIIMHTHTQPLLKRWSGPTACLDPYVISRAIAARKHWI